MNTGQLVSCGYPRRGFERAAGTDLTGRREERTPFFRTQKRRTTLTLSLPGKEDGKHCRRNQRKSGCASVKGAKLTAEMLQKAIKAMLAQAKKQQEKQLHGKQTLKQLTKQNAGVSNIEITEGNIKAFESTAKKYGIDFA